MRLGTGRALMLAGALALPGAALAAEPTDIEALYEKALQSIAEGRKTDASATLKEVIEQEPLHAGAYLEVALIQCSLGRSDEAERLFAIVETRFNPPAEIQSLISQARETGCSKWSPMSTATLSVGRGIDQNVNQGASNPSYTGGGNVDVLLPDFLPKHDQYSALSADYLREITPNGAAGFAQFQWRRNDSLHDFDSLSLSLGVEAPHRLGNWAMRSAAVVGLVTLGGQFYQRQVHLQARVSPPLPLPAGMDSNLIASIARTQYTTLVNFDSASSELRAQLGYRKGNLYTSASIGVQYDRALGQRPGGDRQGQAFNLLGRRKLSEALKGEVGFSHQRWDYDELYSPGVIDIQRAQTTRLLRAALVYSLGTNHSLQLEARVVRNKDNISFFQYNNRQLQLNWQWQKP